MVSIVRPTPGTNAIASADEPPPGSPWDDVLERAPLAFLDLEMTGLDPGSDRVVQICVERVVGAETVARLCSFVRPPELGGSAVHGIGPAELDGAPSFAELAAELVVALEGAVLVAHAAAHDVAFLRHELGRLGHLWDCPFRLDTLALARIALALPRHGLRHLAAAFGIEQHRPHRADDDVRVLRAVWGHLIEPLRPSCPRQLWHAQGPSRATIEARLDTVRRALELGRPVRVRYRRSGRPVEQLQLCVTAVRTDLDPPMVLGYLLPTRGRRELRGDRILAVELAEGQ